MSDPQNEYYLAVSQHTAILIDLANMRAELNDLQNDRKVSTATIERMQRKVKGLVRLALASQHVVALKEEALAKLS